MRNMGSVRCSKFYFVPACNPANIAWWPTCNLHRIQAEEVNPDSSMRSRAVFGESHANLNIIDTSKTYFTDMMTPVPTTTKVPGGLFAHR